MEHSLEKASIKIGAIFHRRRSACDGISRYAEYRNPGQPGGTRRPFLSRAGYVAISFSENGELPTVGSGPMPQPSALYNAMALIYEAVSA